jgi:DNA-binding response OmpR family regulator
MARSGLQLRAVPAERVVQERRSDEMRVLVIDDEPDVLLLCRVNFEFAGHEVLETSDAERAVALATSERPDLIVLDVMLPSHDGLSILEELAELPETKQVPVVLLTAKAQEDDQLKGWKAGAAEYVTKPFSPISLTKAAETILGMTPAEREERRDQAVAELVARA